MLMSNTLYAYIEQTVCLFFIGKLSLSNNGSFMFLKA